MTTKKSFFRVSYNAPVTLTFVLLAVALFCFDYFITKNHFFLRLLCCKGSKSSTAPFNIKRAFDYVRLFSHVLVHTDWNHLLGNLPLILLLGPILEERYGQKILVLMMSITAFFTGVLNALFINSALCGASGIVYMMILLCSFCPGSASSPLGTKQIPLSFILVFILYLGGEFFSKGQTSQQENIATFAHIAGGLCGSLFAFMVQPASKKRLQTKQNLKTKNDPRSFNKNTNTANTQETIVGQIPL